MGQVELSVLGREVRASRRQTWPGHVEGSKLAEMGV